MALSEDEELELLELEEEEYQDSLRKQADLNQKEPSVSFLEAAGRGASQGATLGFGDELSAALGALAPTATDEELDRSYVDRYRAIKEQIEKENIEAEKQRPGAFLAGEVLGGGLTSGAGTSAVRAVTKSADLLRKAGAGKTLTRIGQYAVPAAVEGGIYGAGTSQADLTKGEVGELAKDIGIGGTIGLAAGAAVPAATKVGKKALDLSNAGAKKLKEIATSIVEDKPFFGAFKAGTEGKALYSRAKVEQLLKGPTEKLAYELAKEVSDLGEKAAKPAAQKIEDAYRKTLEEAGKKLKLTGDNFSNFIKDKIDEYGKNIGTIYKEAEDAGKTVDISDILKSAKESIESLELSGTESITRAKKLSDIFNKNLFDEIKTERKITEMFNVAPEGKLTSTLRKVEEVGKEMTPEQLKRASTLPATEVQPKIAKEATLYLPGQRQLEKMTEEELITRLPKGEVPVKIARAIKNTLGDAAGNKDLEGALQAAAGKAYDNIKVAINKVFEGQRDYITANKGYSALKDILEIAGEKNIQVDKITKETLTPEKFAKIFEKIGNAFKESDFYTYNRIMEKLKTIAPEAAETFDKDLQKFSGKQAEILKLKNLEPLEKGKALLKEGVSELKEPISELTNVEQLKRQIGELDPYKRRLTEAGEYIEIPESKVRTFISRLGQNYFDGVPGKAEDAIETINILRKYNPELAEKLVTEGAELAELSRIGRVSAKTDAITGEASFSGRGVIFGSLSQIFVGGANIAGLGVRKVRLDKLAKAVSDSPKFFGKYYEPLQNAINKGSVPFSLVVNILAKEDPEFKETVDKVGEAYGYDEERQSDTNRVKNYITMMPQEEIPAEYNRFIQPLKKAAERGESALKSTIYILSQQDPKFREFLEKMKETE